MYHHITQIKYHLQLCKVEQKLESTNHRSKRDIPVTNLVLRDSITEDYRNMQMSDIRLVHTKAIRWKY